MHELSIAQNIIEIVIINAQQAKAKCVTEVTVQIGTVSGVVPESLQFVWDMATKDTIVENAELIIDVIEPKAVCRNCKYEFEPNESYNCPKCTSSDYDIILGRELKVISFKIE